MFLWTVAPPLLKHWPQCPVPCLDICLEPWSLSRIKEYERCSAATRTPEDPHHYSGRELELSSEVSLPFVSRNSGTVAQPFWTWRCYCWLNRLLGCADSCRMTNLLVIMACHTSMSTHSRCMWFSTMETEWFPGSLRWQVVSLYSWRHSRPDCDFLAIFRCWLHGEDNVDGLV